MAGLARRPWTPRSSALPAAPSSQRVTRLTSSARWRGGGPSNSSGGAAASRSRSTPAWSPGGDQAHGGELAPPDHRHHPPVGVGEAEHDLVGAGQGGAPACLGQGAGERLQPVPGAGRLLVALLGRVGGHAPAQRAEHGLGVAVQGGLEGGHQRGVALLADGARARPQAAAQLQQGAGRPAATRPQAPGAAAQRQGVLDRRLDQLGLAGRGERAQVAGAVGLDPADQREPREPLPGQLEVSEQNVYPMTLTCGIKQEGTCHPGGNTQPGMGRRLGPHLVGPNRHPAGQLREPAAAQPADGTRLRAEAQARLRLLRTRQERQQAHHAPRAGARHQRRRQGEGGRGAAPSSVDRLSRLGMRHVGEMLDAVDAVGAGSSSTRATWTAPSRQAAPSSRSCPSRPATRRTCSRGGSRRGVRAAASRASGPVDIPTVPGRRRQADPAP